MGSSIYSIGSDNQLTVLQRTPYESEERLQLLLARHPALLALVAGKEGDLLLIGREQSVPDEADGTGRWSLDHLFLDRQGVPVLVEVKRADDTRARREVVAQMLDYAANGVAYWPIERIMAGFQKTAAEIGQEPDDLLATFLGSAAVEAFWRQVEANLRSGRVRMIFVADRIPKELARIVEFLNEQMRPAEVLAVEVEQFAHAAGARTLVPRLVGATERAQSAKSVTPICDQFSEAEWVRGIGDRYGARAREGAERALAWLRDAGFDMEISKYQDGLQATLVQPDGVPVRPFAIRRGTGRFEISLQKLATVPCFRGESAREVLLKEILALPTKIRNSGNLSGTPSIALDELMKETVWTSFLRIAEEICSKIILAEQPASVA